MATIYAYDQLNFDTLNLNSMVVGATAAYRYTSLSYNGVLYPTVLRYDYNFGGSSYYTAFGGTNLNFNSITKIPISGTVTGFIQDRSGFGTQYTIENMSISAVTLYNAARTASTTDDLSILTNALAGNDFIYGGNYNDKLYGYAGNDLLNGGGGADILIGGLGNDTYVVDNVGDVLTELANQGTDNVQSSVTYTLGNNIENLTLTGSGNINGYGNSLNNVINGNSGNNILSGNGGTDTLNGGAGNDQYNFTAGIGSATIVDTSGIDTLNFDTSLFASLLYNVDINRTGTNNTNLAVTVSQGTSTLQTVTVNNAYQAGALGAGALESLSLIDSSETISYSAIHGLSGSSSNELIVGFAINDTLTGGNGRDLLAGGAGNDNITGGSGNDILIGGVGIDTFRVDSGLDTIFDLGRGGADIINVSSGATGQFIIASAWTATNQSINNGSTVESAGIVTNGLAVNLSAITSGNAGFVIANIGGATSLTGSGLSDAIQGFTGNDIISGGAGNDRLISGLGNDTLTGGLGNDTFVFNTVLNSTSNRDTITDFTNNNDTIQLSKSVMSALANLGTLSAADFKFSTQTLDSSDRIIYNQSTGALFYDADGSGSSAALQIALLGSRPVGIDNTDFTIIA